MTHKYVFIILSEMLAEYFVNNLDVTNISGPGELIQYSDQAMGWTTEKSRFDSR
jgi:hypothetical protein